MSDEPEKINATLLAAYAYVNSVVDTADDKSRKMWHGWALREAFEAGVKWTDTRTCEWTRRYPRYHHDTSCGIMWIVGEEDLLEHGYKYCPNCGRRIVLVKS